MNVAPPSVATTSLATLYSLIFGTSDLPFASISARFQTWNPAGAAVCAATAIVKSRDNTTTRISDLVSPPLARARRSLRSHLARSSLNWPRRVDREPRDGADDA